MNFYKLTNEAKDKEGKDKNFAAHEAAISVYVNKVKSDISADPTFWDDLFMRATGCQIKACEPSDGTGLKLCRDCTAEN